MACWRCCRTEALSTKQPAPWGGTLTQWLDWQLQLHSQSIDLGLARVSQVLKRLQLDTQTPRIVTVAGTNGKGSCVQALQTLARNASLNNGCYTSPHLWDYNERIQINGQPADDARIVAAFEAIEQCRGEISLSYFEFGTLAALYLFAQAELDLWLLEVGLGGRLDAVNMVDTDVAVVTSIGLDHQDWLGNDLDVIAQEKAAIARPHRPLLLGPGVPAAAEVLGRTIGAQVMPWSQAQANHILAPAQLPSGLIASNLQLACLAMQALEIDIHPLPDLAQLQLAGRCQSQQIKGRQEIYDVAHNPAAIAHLSQYLARLPTCAPVVAVFSVLQDKAVDEMVQSLLPWVDIWCIAPLAQARAMDVERMQQALSGAADVRTFANLEQALQHARQRARRLLVCGSFFTVAAARQD